MDNTKGYRFEKKVAETFRRKGYDVQVTSKSGDYGIDIIMRKKGKTYGVECKDFAGHPVGRPIIQKLDSALNHNPYLKRSFDYGIVVTSSWFSNEAVENVKLLNSHYGYKKIMLVDGQMFRKMYNAVPWWKRILPKKWKMYVAMIVVLMGIVLYAWNYLCTAGILH